jgi:radical SAM superfamily enzyme YgiQ (UPF0313 family)
VKIVLATLNAKYIHASFGLRYLLANLGSLRSEACILEFDLQQRAVDVIEAILAREPKIVGFGVYIWNVAATTEVIAALKRIAPEVTVIIGGPEVSFEVEEQEIARLADYVVTGEADLKFAEVCREILAGTPPREKIIPAPIPDLAQLALPYDPRRTLPTGSFMWRRRGGVRSRASFAFRRWMCRCANFA